jgi:hypothetical protein
MRKPEESGLVDVGDPAATLLPGSYAGEQPDRTSSPTSR